MCLTVLVRDDIKKALGEYTEDVKKIMKKCKMMYEDGYQQSNGEPIWKSVEPELLPGERQVIFINQDESGFWVLDNDTGVWLKYGSGQQREKGKGERRLMRKL